MWKCVILLYFAIVVVGLCVGATIFADMKEEQYSIDRSNAPGLDAVDSITLYFISADQELWWSSPAAVSMSAMRNYINAYTRRFSHPIGHAAIHIQCGFPPAAKLFDNWAAVTGGGIRSDLWRFLFEGAGFSLMLGEFDGSMVSQADITNELIPRIAQGNARWIRFLLSEDECQEVRRYYEQFISQRVYKRFGLLLDPRSEQGAGCTTFVLSFLDVLGINFPYPDWRRTLNIPKGLVSTKGAVPLFDMFVSKEAWAWAGEDDPQIRITFFDIGKIYAWIDSIGADDMGVVDGLQIKKSMLGKAVGLTVDARFISLARGPLITK
jgi:hypothetical protein